MYEELKFDLARNSLRYLIKSYDIKELHVPYYLCDVIRHAVVAEGCKPLFYHIDDNFMPAKDFGIYEYILYPNYFGVCDKNVDIMDERYPNLIVDDAHSFYSEPKGFACFNSKKKFQPKENGSYLWIKKGGTQIKKNFQSEFPIHRRNKYEQVMAFFCDSNCLKIDLENVKSPFCYPYLANSDEEADKIAEKLIRAGKTVYRYWNPLPKSYNEYKFYRRLVPIPYMQISAI